MRMHRPDRDEQLVGDLLIRPAPRHPRDKTGHEFAGGAPKRSRSGGRTTFKGHVAWAKPAVRVKADRG